MTNGTYKVMKNTIALYVRMIFLTLISLFAYRIVFQALGASDYGTYNVVGGFVSMFSFVSSTMLAASQRYFALGLVNDDWSKVNKSFSINLVIYVFLCGIVLIIAETIGLWFVVNKLNVDYNRMTEILVVYQTSVMVFLIGMIVSPFRALLVADENLPVYAWVSVVEGILKLLVAYTIYIFGRRKLIVYAFLLFLVSVIINGFYIYYCIRKYKKLRFDMSKEISEYKSVLIYINWNMIGAIAAVFKSQGVNIIINIFFGTVVNAARAIAYQLNTVISSFAQNFMKAVEPHITKTYGKGNDRAFMAGVYTSSKISYYLLLIIAVPFIANVSYVLKLWLGEIPEYATVFTVLALTDALILSVTDPLLTAVQAIGKIKTYQLTVGILSLMNLPVTYLLLKAYSNPIIPFIVAIGLDILVTIGRMVNFKLIYPFSLLRFSFEIFFPAIIITAISLIVSILLLGNATSFLNLIANVLLTIFLIVVLILFIGFNQRERNMIYRMLYTIRRIKF